MLDSIQTRASGKHAGRKRESTRRDVLGWPDVLRVIQADETRSTVLSAYRDAGFTPDDFGHSSAARRAMADALTRAEDWLEGFGVRRDAERAGIRAVRRQLEAALWP